ncbi:uncharacterized protein LOC110718341 [Chenopodium quinoa]|uniref:uncharacterized protein LOC110718341 n=1 Tax=Chenopodium quinoa TaxID=63459 RepID=UPI000B770384|nr:uncharacterized protein LOC110718341 [Chenopodium quinoa]
MGYVPGAGLGRNGEGMRHPILIIDKRNCHGLGFDENMGSKVMKKKSLTLNGQFVLQNDTEPFYEFLEPWYDLDKEKILPRLEIFFAEARNEEFTKKWFDKKPVSKKDFDWVDHLKQRVLRGLFSSIFDYEVRLDPITLITPIKTEVGNNIRSENREKFPFFPKLYTFQSSISDGYETDSSSSSQSFIHTPPDIPYHEDIDKITCTDNDVKEVKIGSTLSLDEQNAFVILLKKYVDVFAWSYADMPGVDRSIAEHRIPLYPDSKPKQQKLRRMKLEVSLKVKEEIQKQLEANFIKPIKHPEWLANVVVVPKKDGRVRVCIDFRDLNSASPKDYFPLPHIDVLVHNTTGHAMFSFMDGFSGYNQVLMSEEDMSKTSFITPWGTFCYRAMPFGLKNAGATYQRAATTILHDLIHDIVEVYVDDMIVKSHDRETHLDALKSFFDRIRKYNLRLNPQKCVFGVTSGKILGFVVSQDGIKVDSDKVKAIQELPPPRTEKEIRGFLGRIQYISRFISQLTTRCEPIFMLLKKNVPTKWNDECQASFDSMKKYLSNPPVLMLSKPGQPLILYLTITETAMGALLAQYQEGTRKEIAIYYLSKKFLEYETRYSPLERACIALIYETKKLRHYLQAHTTYLVSRIVIQCVNQKSVKGRAISEALADGPISGDEFDDDFPDEHIFCLSTSQWTMYFDGASNRRGNGAGVFLIDPYGVHIPFAVKLSFPTTNNMAENEACIYGIKAALAAGAKNLTVYDDSYLIISQTIGAWKVRDERLQMYTEYLQKFIPFFEEIEFKHLPREQNSFTDALANLAVNLTWDDDVKVQSVTIVEKEIPVVNFKPTIALLTQEDDKDTWYTDVKKYLINGEYPEGSHKKDQLAIRRLASHFTMLKGLLYHKIFDGNLQLCIDGELTQRIMEEVHGGECGPHMNGRMLARKILRAGYYWTTLESDCIHFVRT